MADPRPNPTVPLHLTEPEPTDLSLDALAESIRATYAKATRRSWEAVEAYLAVGRALAEARRRFPSDREFGGWFKSEALGFSQQRAWTLRWAGENEADVRAVLTSQLVSGRTPNIEYAVEELRNRRTGPPGCTGHPHIRHPYPSSGFLCLTAAADPVERLAWADHLAAVAAAHSCRDRPCQELGAVTEPVQMPNVLMLRAARGLLLGQRRVLDEQIVRVERALADAPLGEP